MSDNPLTGTVKFYLERVGHSYGFISVEGQKDVFVRGDFVKASGIEGPLEAGQHVQFDLIDTAPGRQAAANIKLVP